jgi:uncharacterized protein YjbI with pentapeptide repeats
VPLTPRPSPNTLPRVYPDAAQEPTEMANPEHLEILKQGVEAWNIMREETRTVPYLRGYSPEHVLLQYKDLRGINLSNAIIEGIHFRHIALDNANLSDIGIGNCRFEQVSFKYANLNTALIKDTKIFRSDFAGADLTHADVSWADLSYSTFQGANLTYANLARTNLSYADLSNATLAGAMLGYTLLCGADLTGVVGLNGIQPLAPSIIDLQTLALSGKLPLNFLRGCGLPDAFIEYVPSLLNTPIEFYSCFISYSSTDQEFADRLHADLQNKGVRCWFAPEDLKIGDRFRDRIDESIRLHDKLLLILSKNSVSSQWVGDEVEAALEREQKENGTVLFPIRIDDAVMDSDKAWAATIRRTRHVGDFTRWKEHDSYQRAFERLLRDLKAGA